MKNIKIKTDNLSFENYLNALDICSIIEHLRENILYEIIAYVILENEHLHDDSLAKLLNKKIKLPQKMVKPLLKNELEVASEEEIIEMMIDLFSKKLMIDTLLEYTVEDARKDIIDNMNSWNKPNTQSINYN